MKPPGNGARRSADVLLEALYASVLEEGQLETFNRLLAQATGASIVAVLRHDVEHGQGNVALIHGADPDRFNAALAEHDLHDDPWIIRVVPQLATGKVIDSDSLLPRREMQQTEAFNRYYRQVDVGQQVASVGHYDGANSVTLSICREVGATAFSTRELGILQALTPHWVNAYAIQRRLSWLQQRVGTLEQAVDRLPTAMLLLDREQCVVRMNAAAEQLLAQGELLALHRRRPMACFQPRSLQVLLQRACKGVEQNGRQQRYGGTATLMDSQGRSALIAHAHPVAPAAGDGSPEAAIVFLQPVGASLSRNFKELLQALFSLTAAEAVLAETLYLHPDLAEAASRSGISSATAQTRLKVIYDKTGERGQAALVRLLSAVAAAAPLLPEADAHAPHR